VQLITPSTEYALKLRKAVIKHKARLIA